MDIEKKLNELKDKLDKAKTIKYRAEAKLEQLQHQKKEIIREIEALGVKPENLESEIGILEGDIKKLINEAESLLPDDME